MRRRVVALITACLVLSALEAGAQTVPVETYTLPNGLAVTLYEDHSLPQVVVNTWFSVGSKDEAAKRSGFAHLFEHLMFMGTKRAPGNRFDVLMESGGGANNASTNTDRTNYYSWGPSSLLPTLLWLDADRLEGLGKAMTQEKLDLQRKVVLNERRQNYENRPYGKAYLIIPGALYPADHPYHHSVIGSHEDIESATLGDVKAFFADYYVPGNASLVVAGDFDKEAVKKVIAQTYGAIPARPLPVHKTAPPVHLKGEVRRMAVDKVKYPRLWLVWPSPPAFRDGDAQMDLVAAVFAKGESGRLYKKLVLDDRIAQKVSVYQNSKELSSEFVVDVTAADGADLEAVKHAVLEEVDRFKETGPTEAELARVKAATESDFLRGMENLRARADMLNAYRHSYGRADSFKRDMERRLAPGSDSVRSWASKVLGEGRLDFRILPEGAKTPEANLDDMPKNFPPREVKPPVPVKMTLANGVPLYVVNRPGTGLFSGMLWVDGGERLVPADKAGLAALAASMLTDGAGSLDAAAYADAAASLGASVEAWSDWHGLTLNVRGLSSKLGKTLDLFADAVVRPAMKEKDFAREKELALAAIKARTENPQAVANVVSRALIFGREDPRGRPEKGYADTVKGLTRADVLSLLPRLLNRKAAGLLFVGDFQPAALRDALDSRLKGWKAEGPKPPPLPEPFLTTKHPGFVLVDRPDAAQTVLVLMRPVPPAGDSKRAVRACLNTVFGGSFTSRLMQNIREKHGYSYGAYSALWQSGNQFFAYAGSAVKTAVTGDALEEFKKECEALHEGNVSPEELLKAKRTVRYELASSAETTSKLAFTLKRLLADGRPLDSVSRELAALKGVSLDGVNGSARSGLFRWDDMLILMVGDKKAVLPQLQAKGLPEPAMADTEGRMLE